MAVLLTYAKTRLNKIFEIKTAVAAENPRGWPLRPSMLKVRWSALGPGIGPY